MKQTKLERNEESKILGVGEYKYFVADGGALLPMCWKTEGQGKSSAREQILI